MRRRLLLAFVGLALSAVLVLGIPLVLLGRALVREDAARRADREADNVALAVEDDVERGQPVSDEDLAPFTATGNYVVVVARDGSIVTAGTPLPDEAVTGRVDLGQGAGVMVAVPDDDVDHRQSLVVYLVSGLALAGVSLAAILGLLVARRLTRPLDDLAVVSRRLGEGDFSARSTPSGVPEVDAVGEALDASAARIDALVTAERQFSANASHQLRTPLTALRMRLEEIGTIGDDDVRAEADRALAQADRLDTTITDLLRLAREGRPGGARNIDLSAVVRSRAAAWGRVLGAARRRLELDVPDGCRALASPGGAGQALEALVENALRHGAGTVTVRVVPEEGHVSVTVADEGAGIQRGHERSVFDRHVSLGGGTGVGLALARTLAEADGGRLELVQARPPVFRLLYASE